MSGAGKGWGVPPVAAAEIAEERRLAAAMPSLGDSSDHTSRAVRAQYEANPIPAGARRRPARKSRLPGHLAALGTPQAGRWKCWLPDAAPGSNRSTLARMDSSLAITALDLSAASAGLWRAHGRRAWHRGRPLRPGRHPRRREARPALRAGEQHRGAPPYGAARGRARGAGRRACAGGVLRIALYSERARAWVAEAHRVIAEHGWDASPAGIRAFRTHILRAAGEPALARLRESDDFYTLSGCRDLCFHAREHWYRLPAIGEMLATAGLELLMLDAPPEAQARFAQIYGAAAGRRATLRHGTGSRPSIRSCSRACSTLVPQAGLGSSRIQRTPSSPRRRGVQRSTGYRRHRANAVGEDGARHTGSALGPGSSPARG